MYLPGCKPPIRKSPLSDVFWVAEIPFDGSFKWTDALGTAAPEVSRMRPEIEPEMLCAKLELASSNRSGTRSVVVFDMKPLSEVLLAVTSWPAPTQDLVGIVGFRLFHSKRFLTNGAAPCLTGSPILEDGIRW